MKVFKNKSNRLSHKPLGWLLFAIGVAMLGVGLAYDATVPSGEFGFERSYNLGKLNAKKTYTNTGGFLAVCGAIFIRDEPKREQNNQEGREEKK